MNLISQGDGFPEAIRDIRRMDSASDRVIISHEIFHSRSRQIECAASGRKCGHWPQRKPADCVRGCRQRLWYLTTGETAKLSVQVQVESAATGHSGNLQIDVWWQSKAVVLSHRWSRQIECTGSSRKCGYWPQRKPPDRVCGGSQRLWYLATGEAVKLSVRVQVESAATGRSGNQQIVCVVADKDCGT